MCLERSEEARYLGAMLTASLQETKTNCIEHWDRDAVAEFELTLRCLVRHASPTFSQRRAREGVIDRLSTLAKSGIRFCHGLFIEPYGSFVSGLYTPNGDLDLSIEGVAQMVNENRASTIVPVAEMERRDRQNFLHALAGRLRARGVEELVKITHARVPIIKFTDNITGIECDVAVDSLGAQFKSAAMGLLAGLDWRFGAMVRLVKLWARHHSLNDSSQGTFNSFALTLLIVFHLQNRTPAVLPPLYQLFLPQGRNPANADLRPMANGKKPHLMFLTEMQSRVNNILRTQPPQNTETLTELLTSFFAMFRGLMTGWCGEDEALGRVLRRVRVDTWQGILHSIPWEVEDGVYFCSIEDPFDRTDNCGRTIRDLGNIEKIRSALDDAVDACANLEDIMDVNVRTDDPLILLFGEETLKHAYKEDLAKATANATQNGAAPVPQTKMWIPSSMQNVVSLEQPKPTIADHTKRKKLEESVPVADLPLELPLASLRGEQPFEGIELPPPKTPDVVEKSVEDGAENALEAEQSSFSSAPLSAVDVSTPDGPEEPFNWQGLRILIGEAAAALKEEAAEKEEAARIRREARLEKRRKKREEKEKVKALENKKEKPAAMAATPAAPAAAAAGGKKKGPQQQQQQQQQQGDGRDVQISGTQTPTVIEEQLNGGTITPIADDSRSVRSDADSIVERGGGGGGRGRGRGRGRGDGGPSRQQSTRREQREPRPGQRQRWESRADAIRSDDGKAEAEKKRQEAIKKRRAENPVRLILEAELKRAWESRRGRGGRGGGPTLAGRGGRGPGVSGDETPPPGFEPRVRYQPVPLPASAAAAAGVNPGSNTDGASHGGGDDSSRRGRDRPPVPPSASAEDESEEPRRRRGRGSFRWQGDGSASGGGGNGGGSHGGSANASSAPSRTNSGVLAPSQN